MSATETQSFLRLSDGTTLARQPDGSYLPVRTETDWAWLDALSESEIEHMTATDPDHPALDDAFWASADRQTAEKMTGTIKLDRDILTYFSQQGRDFQATINALLRRYVEARQREPG